MELDYTSSSEDFIYKPMKTKNKIIISFTLSALMIFVGLPIAFAAESDWQNLNPTIESGITGTVNNCSPLTVANGTISAYPTCAISCNSGYTVSGSSCVASGGGGGGGGGTPAVTTTTTTPITTTTTVTIPGLNLPYSNPTTTEQTAANRTALINFIVALIQSRMTTNNPVVTAGIPSGFQFVNNLTLGSVGMDVKYLQILLNSDSATAIGNKGQETTYFGSLTRVAVGKFQIKYGLITGISDIGYGFVGSKTRAKLNSLIGQ